MDQKKIGGFLRELRKESCLTQEQLSEKLGVTNRSVSRWENGTNMPDFDLVIELVNLYDISIEEFLDGERKNNMIEKEKEETLLKVAEYENNDKMKLSKRTRWVFILALIAQIVVIVLGMLKSEGVIGTSGWYDMISGFASGMVFGILLVGVLATTKYGAKIKAFKMRLLKREMQ